MFRYGLWSYSKIPKTWNGISTCGEYFTKIYNEDMSTLGVSLPDIQPKATDHIKEMIDLITKLIEGGNAYEKNGHV